MVSLHQDHDESFRTFSTRVQSKAESCNFTTISDCECVMKNITSNTEEAIKDVMPEGVGDENIRREVLRNEDILSRSSFQIISLMEVRKRADMQQRSLEINQRYLCLNDRKTNLLMYSLKRCKKLFEREKTQYVNVCCLLIFLAKKIMLLCYVNL